MPTQEALARANETAEEAISSIRTVISLAKEDFEKARYRHTMERYYNLSILQGQLDGLYFTLVSSFLMQTVLTGALLLYGCHLVLRNAASFIRSCHRTLMAKFADAYVVMWLSFLSPPLQERAQRRQPHCYPVLPGATDVRIQQCPRHRAEAVQGHSLSLKCAIISPSKGRQQIQDFIVIVRPLAEWRCSEEDLRDH